MILHDSNLVIYATDPAQGDLRKFIRENDTAVGALLRFRWRCRSWMKPFGSGSSERCPSATR